jgi:predicted RNase H-like HicB family nuclease
MPTFTFPAIVERSEAGLGAWFPDLPGCVTAAESAAELGPMAREALTLHLEGMLEDGLPIPAPSGLDHLPRDREANELGVLLVTAAPGTAEVTLALSTDALHRADDAAARTGRTRAQVLAEQLEASFAA